MKAHKNLDIDDENVRTARENVTNNGLDSRIRVFKTERKDDLIPLDTKLDVQRLDFTMCNPPFYASREEMIASAEAKERPPFSACTGDEVEMVTEGGENAFVHRMIEESLHLRERVVWYTSMLGKLSSVSVIVEKLMEHGNNNYGVTEFVQGSKTKRWAVAWSWTDLRPSMVCFNTSWSSV
jgi:23S rRNA (adenine1618-N6)-methyltransferase